MTFNLFGHEEGASLQCFVVSSRWQGSTTWREKYNKEVQHESLQKISKKSLD